MWEPFSPPPRSRTQRGQAVRAGLAQWLLTAIQRTARWRAIRVQRTDESLGHAGHDHAADCCTGHRHLQTDFGGRQSQGCRGAPVLGPATDISPARSNDCLTSARPVDADPLQPQARASCASAKSPKRMVEIGRDRRPCSGSGRRCGACCPTGGDRASISQAATKNSWPVSIVRGLTHPARRTAMVAVPTHVPPCTGDDP